MTNTKPSHCIRINSDAKSSSHLKVTEFLCFLGTDAALKIRFFQKACPEVLRDRIFFLHPDLCITMRAYLWENESGIKLSGILQVGDMGAFPNPFNDATQKYAQIDPDELGFHKFCTQTEESEFYLARQNTPNTYFIRGNHEDFDYLDSFSMPETVDPWQRLHFIPDGQQITLFKHCITIGGFSGIPPSTEQRARGKKARQKYRKAHRHASTSGRFFSPVKAKSAFNKSEKIDILMTHAGPQCPDLQCGSIYLTELAKRIRPKVHLFGHHHQVIVKGRVIHYWWD